MKPAGKGEDVAAVEPRKRVSAETSPPKLISIENSDSDQAEWWLHRGCKQWLDGDSVGAVASYDKAIQIKPDLHQVWLNRGAALFGLEEYEEAIASFDKAIQIKPNNHKAWLNRGDSVGSSRHYNPAAATFLQFQFPNVSPILPNPTLTQRGYQGQLLSYQEGLKHCPQDTHPEGWGRLHQAIGNAHYWEGKYQRNYRNY
ncbi:tetratricopeptide repeat protein, partial [Coleofasciculus sp. LEGE 07092]|uniref:tetratricopeptide repeat protein n=1 Tax=Coleofasciculus sp. LEGE 07092 TaxID=2777969 RepID=UPI001D1430B9